MPTEEKATRKLRAILSADVKGYSLLMADDEAFTVKTLKTYKALMSKRIDYHTGRVVDAPGDNLLAEFESAVDAVECAVEIQKALNARNNDLPVEKRLEFRIGVNIGDVIQDGNNLYGEGVNIAARIEGLAEPGGVCISRNAYDHVKNKLTLGYEYIGEHSVKNIKDPVRVYKLLMADEDAGKLVGDKPKPAVKNWIWATIVVAAVVITSVVILIYQNISKPEFEPPKIEEMAYPLPEKPSIAVLPFDNLSNDPEQKYFSDGMADELLNGLAKIPGLIVKARKSSFSDKIRNQDAKTIGDMLDVTHFIEGSVRKSGDRIRVVVQLISTDEDTHVWSERFDRELTEVFAVQDEITGAILKALNIHLLGSEKSRKPTDNMEAYQAYLLGRQRLFTDSVTAFSEAVSYFQKAVDLDKDFALAYVGLADSYLRHMWYSGLYNPWPKAEAAIERALNLDDRLGEAYSSLGLLRWFERRSDEAEMAFKRALELNPNYIDAYFYYGLMLLDTGRFEEALVQFQRGIKLDPLEMNINRRMASALEALGRFDEAFIQYDKVIEINPLSWTVYNNKGLYYCYLGRLDDAFIMYRKAISLDPNEHILMANIGELYLTLGDIKQAEYWYQQAIWMSPNGLASEKGMFDLNVYLGKGNFAHNYGRNLMQHPKRNKYLIPILAYFQELDLQAGRNDEARAWFGQDYPELLLDTAPTIDFNNYEAAIAFTPALIKTGEQARANLLLNSSLNYIRTLPRLGMDGFGIADVHIYTLQGQIREALGSLREAVDSGWRMGWWSLQMDPILKPLHNEPEFKAIVQEIKVDMAAQLARIRSRESLSPIVDLYEQAKPEAKPEALAMLMPKGVTVANGVLTHSNVPAFTLEIPLACKPRQPDLWSGEIYECDQGIEPWTLIVYVYYLEEDLETAAKDLVDRQMAWIKSKKRNGKVLNIAPIDTYDEFKAMQVEIEYKSADGTKMRTISNHLIEKEGKVIQMTAWVMSDPSLATDIFESIDLDP